MLIMFTGKRISRWEGAVLLAAYVGYTAFLFVTRVAPQATASL
jgi:Ca2+/Na+ antiporter